MSTASFSPRAFLSHHILRGVNKSIVWKLVLPVPVMLAVAIIAVWFFVPRMLADNARENAVQSATQTVSRFKTLRGYYTKTEAKSVPLPATLIHDLSALLSEEETTIVLYSAYPFPVRKDRMLDDFQRAARPKNASIRDHKSQTGGFFSGLSAQGVTRCNKQQSKEPRCDIT